MARQGFDKEKKREYVQRKKNELEEMLKNAFCDEKTLSELTKMFVVQTKAEFYKYSLLNTFLICMQGGTIALSFKKWKEKGRFVKKGAKGLKIFVPLIYKKFMCPVCGEQPKNEYEAKKHIRSCQTTLRDMSLGEMVTYKLGNVFDINDTGGKEIDFNYENNSKETSTFKFESIKSVLSKEYDFAIKEIFSQARGYVECKKESAKIIYLSELNNETDKIKTLFHELAHLLLHVRDDEKGKLMNEGSREVEAEAVSYIMTSYLGLDVKFSAAYIKCWSEKSVLKEVNFFKVCKLAEGLIELLNKNMDLIQKAS